MRRLAIAVLVTLAGLVTLGGPAAAQDDADTPDLVVDVVQVSGLVDPILLDSIRSAIDKAEADGVQALVLQMNSRGTVVSSDDIEDLLFHQKTQIEGIMQLSHLVRISAQADIREN